MSRRRAVLAVGATGALLVVGALVLVAGDGDDGSPRAGPTTSAPVTSAPAPTTTSAPPDPGEACIADWPVRRQVGQLLAVAVDGGALEAEAARVAELGAGAVLLQRATGAGLAEGIVAVKQAGPIPPLVMADEEGGEVQTLGAVLGPLPSPAEVAATLSPTEARDLVGRHARAVADQGVDVVLGPVVDVAPDDGRGPLGGRLFGADPAVVTAYAQAYVEAYEAAGVTTVLKHFPGHGAASGDSHEGPVSVPPSDELRARDLLPYEDLLGRVGAVMVGHLVVPDLTGLAPASQSPEAMDGLLRSEYGHDGLVVTDSLSMGAIAFRTPPTEAAVQAVDAGADLALFVTLADPEAVLDALVTAVEQGRLGRRQVVASVARVLAAKGVDPCTIRF